MTAHLVMSLEHALKKDLFYYLHEFGDDEYIDLIRELRRIVDDREAKHFERPLIRSTERRETVSHGAPEVR